MTSNATLGESAAGLLSDHPNATALHYRILWLCFLAWIFDFYDLILYAFLLVPIARQMGLTSMQSSLALGFSFLMAAIGGIAFGFIGDRFGRRPVMIATVLIYGAGTLLCAASTTFLQLVIFRSLTGLGIGGEWAAGQSMIAETFPAASRARYSAYVQLGAPLGGLLAALAGGYAEPHLGWRMVFVLSAMPAGFVALAVWRWMPESDVWLRGGYRRWIRTNDWNLLRPHRTTLTILFFTLLVSSEAYWFTYSWLPGYLELKRGLTSASSSRLLVGMQIGALFGYGSFGFLADRFGRRPAYSAYAALMAIGLLPPTILWAWSATVPGLIAIAMALTGFGTGIWSGSGPLMSELVPTRLRNSVMGLMLNVTRGFQFFTPIAITALTPRLGFGPTLALGAVFAATGSLLVWGLPETRGRSITSMDLPVFDVPP
jgi:MFS family permease